MSKRKAEEQLTPLQLTPVACIGRTGDKKLKAGIKVTYNPDNTYTLRFDDANNPPFWLEATFTLDAKEKQEKEEDEEEDEDESQELGTWIMHKGKLVPIAEVADKEPDSAPPTE